MKKIILYGGVIALCGLLISCGRTEVRKVFGDPPTKAITVLYDDTSPLAVRPSGADIISLFNFNNSDIYMGYDLRVQKLSNINLTDIYERSVSAQNELTGEEIQRVTMIKSYRAGITKKLNEIASEKNREAPNSVLYRTIAQQLNNLTAKNTNGGTKICLIYSDMEEFSQDANFVSPSGFAEVKKHPEKVAVRLEQIAPLRDLTGIEIHIVFKPISYAQELKFNADMAVFRIIFLKHHATVTVSANVLPNK